MSDEIKRRFQRALFLSWTHKKWLVAFVGLMLFALFMTFAGALGHHVGPWLGSSLRTLALLVSIGALMPLAVVLSKAYHSEVKTGQVSYKEIFIAGGDALVSTAYFSLPLVIAFLAIWVALGIFHLLTVIPALGKVLAVILAFVPFLLNLAVVLLCTAALMGLFFFVPVIAQGQGRPVEMAKGLWRRIQGDLPTHLQLFAIGAAPLVAVLLLLSSAAWLTFIMSGPLHPHSFALAHRFFVMIPFMALLAPAVTFFFNFATEAQRIAQLVAQGKSNELTS